MTERLMAMMMAGLIVGLSACSGGDRPEFDDTEAGAPDPTPEATADEGGDDASVESADVDADEAEPTATPEADEPTPTPEPADPGETTGDEADETGEAEEAPVAEAPPTDSAEFTSQGTVVVTLADGRSYQADVGCEVNTVGETWDFRYGGTSAEGVQLEGAYDSSQPDFVIVFVSGPDALNGNDVLLSNVNGGDDLIETTTGGTDWDATLQLWSPEGASVNAEIAATCG